MEKQKFGIATDTAPLKSIFPDKQQRKIFLQKKLQGSRLRKAFLFRIEPKDSKVKRQQYITIMMDGKTKMAMVNGHVHKKLKLLQGQAFFLFVGKHLVDKDMTVQVLAQKYIQEDGIVYLLYTDVDPFGK